MKKRTTETREFLEKFLSKMGSAIWGIIEGDVVLSTSHKYKSTAEAVLDMLYKCENWEELCELRSALNSSSLKTDGKGSESIRFFINYRCQAFYIETNE